MIIVSFGFEYNCFLGSYEH